MKRFFLFSFMPLLMCPFFAKAQVAFANGDHTFEMGGNLITGYNYRFYPAGTTDVHKNSFFLDQARFYFKGRVGGSLRYKMEMDVADLTADIQTPATPLGFLKDAYVDYLYKTLMIRIGYQKIHAYGFNAVVDEIDDPFFQRPSIASKLNSRRDLGVTASYWFPYLRLTAIGGIYTGMGEQVFAVDNTNGKPEFIGRLEYSYPARNVDEIVSMNDAPYPVFQCGINARYKNGTYTTLADYDLTTIDGKKTCYGFDASIMYRGFSVQVEAHQMRVVPNDSTLLYSEGKKYTYFRAGGYLVELNYYCRKMKSVFAVRYDELNPNDLIFGNTERTMSYCYNYFIRQNFLCLKAAYEEHFNLVYPAGTRYKDDELRVGIQVIFN